jgi:hypothetical protein
MVEVCEGRAEGRRLVVAVADIGAAGAASLAPSLGRMAQLTSLNLFGTLRDTSASCAVSGCLRAPAMSLMMMRAVGLGWLRTGL